MTRHEIQILRAVGMAQAAVAAKTRVSVRSVRRIQGEVPVSVPLLQEAGEVNVVLLNAAVPPARFEWLSQAVTNAKRAGTPARFTGETNSYLFNVHSFNDSANRVLFPVASMLNDDPATCAAGACGVPRYATVCVDESADFAHRSRRKPRQ